MKQNPAIKFVMHIIFRFENQNEIPRILSQIVTLSTVDEEIDRIEQFAKDKKLVDIETALKNTRLNMEWGKKNVPIIINVLKEMHW